MTQEEFAARVGLKTRGAVSKLETGAKQAKGPLLAALRMLAQGREEKQRGRR
jgi:transcriptional regulator with XRE-family HTH domain